MDINYYKQYEPIDGKWYITKQLGSGAFGSVFEVERHDFSTVKSAMKIITIPSSQTEMENFRKENYMMSDEKVEEVFYSTVQEYIREFQLMSMLKGNSNIVSYEDHDVKKRTDFVGWDIFIRMELLTPMNEFFKGHNTRENVIKLGIDICKALEVCQKYNIIHRDIKPTNIFVSETGDFKLGDFGVARILEKTGSNLSKKGTYTYMAPEIFKGERYTAVADIYSLGIVMYKLLNNNLEPFRTGLTFGDGEKALEIRMSGTRIPAPANADARLSEIVLKACEFSPANRYQTPAQMRKRLEDLLEGKFVTESYAPRPNPVANPVPRPAPVNTVVQVSGYNNVRAGYQPESTFAPQPKKKIKKAPIIAAVLLAVVLCVGGTVFGVNYHYNDIYVRAERKLRDDKYDSAKKLFQEIEWYKDSAEMVLKCDYSNAEALLDDGEYDKALKIFEALKKENYSDSDEKANECMMLKAESLYEDGEADKALTILEKLQKNGYEDAEELIQECRYDSAMQLYKDDKFDEAKKLFEDMDDEDMAKECDYGKAMKYKRDGEYTKALQLFNELDGYNDSRTQFSTTERWLIIENGSEDIFAVPEEFTGRYSNDDGFYVEYDVNDDGSTHTEYNLPFEEGKYFKLEDGVHYHGSDSGGWEKQWIYEVVSSKKLAAYDYIDGEVYILELE